MAANKRIRAMHPEETLTFHVLDPNVPPRIEVLEGKRGRATRIITPEIFFEARPDQHFWELWSSFSEKMLRLRSDETPFLDFHAPLSTFEDKTFVMCDWKPEYERHKQHLALLRCEAQLKEAQEDAVRLAEKLASKNARIEILQKRLEEIKKD